MEDIKFDFVDKFGIDRPKSPLSKNLGDLKNIAKTINAVEPNDFIRRQNIQYEKTYLIYSNGNIEYYNDFGNSKKQVDKRTAYFYIKGNSFYFVCAVNHFSINQINSVEKVTIDAIPNEYIINKQIDYYRESNPNNDKTKLDAKSKYVSKRDNPNPIKFYVDGDDSSIQLYSTSNNTKSNLINIPNEIKIELNSNNFISHIFQDTNRRFTNPNLFAGYIGAIFELQNTQNFCTGSCFVDGSCYPSVSHINGLAIDIGFDEETKSNINKGIYKLSEIDIIKIKAFKKFNFNFIMLNRAFRKHINFTELGITEDKKGHKDHIHFGKLNMNSIKNNDIIIA